MTLNVNGTAKDIPDASSVADLLVTLDLAKSPCAVEVNKRLITKRDHATTTLRPRDTVEIVTLVGGG